MPPDARRAPLFRGPGDVFLAVRVASWVARAPRLMSRPDLAQAIGALRGRRTEPPLGEQRALALASRIARYADGWMRRALFGRRVICWKRAIAVYALLPASPGELRIVFGVARTNGGGLEGHAWVERNGVALDGTPPGRYRETFSHPPESGAAEAPAASHIAVP